MRWPLGSSCLPNAVYQAAAGLGPRKVLDWLSLRAGRTEVISVVKVVEHSPLPGYDQGREQHAYVHTCSTPEIAAEVPLMDSTDSSPVLHQRFHHIYDQRSVVQIAAFQVYLRIETHRARDMSSRAALTSSMKVVLGTKVLRRFHLESGLGQHCGQA